MALSIFGIQSGVEWPLGFVGVSSNGTPVNIMSRVDPSNNNAPGTFGANSAQYTPTCHKIFFQGYKPGSNNNGMVINTGTIYILRALGPGNGNAGGPQNRTDSGAMVLVVPPGATGVIPADESDRAAISPYLYTIDADVDGEGGLVTLVGCAK